jgi:hypothetical protein
MSEKEKKEEFNAEKEIASLRVVNEKICDVMEAMTTKLEKLSKIMDAITANWADNVEKKAEWKNLGYMNGWDPDDLPDAYDLCRGMQHIPFARGTPGLNCVTEYFCPDCRIKWQVDSSG